MDPLNPPHTDIISSLPLDRTEDPWFPSSSVAKNSWSWHPTPEIAAAAQAKTGWIALKFGRIDRLFSRDVTADRPRRRYVNIVEKSPFNGYSSRGWSYKVEGAFDEEKWKYFMVH
jgi:hypothetical protein